MVTVFTKEQIESLEFVQQIARFLLFIHILSF